MNEAETCRTMVRPRLDTAGWNIPAQLHETMDAVVELQTLFYAA
jgi:hypothetical protein